MSLRAYINRLKHIDSLIRKRSTGTPEMLAKKLNLSRAGTYKFINEIKEEGFPIAYSKTNKSYYYTQEGKMVNHLFELKTDLDDNDMRQILGGESALFIYQLLELDSSSSYTIPDLCSKIA